MKQIKLTENGGISSWPLFFALKGFPNSQYSGQKQELSD